MKDDLSAPVSKPVTLFHASEADWVRCRADLGELFQGKRYHAFITDGPWLHRTRTGRLIMLWSSYGPTKYATGVAVSTSGRITGPWVQQAPLWLDDGGHPMLFTAFDGRLVMTIHQPNRRVERRGSSRSRTPARRSGSSGRSRTRTHPRRRSHGDRVPARYCSTAFPPSTTVGTTRALRMSSSAISEQVPSRSVGSVVGAASGRTSDSAPSAFGQLSVQKVSKNSREQRFIGRIVGVCAPVAAVRCRSCRRRDPGNRSGASVVAGVGSEPTGIP